MELCDAYYELSRLLCSACTLRSRAFLELSQACQNCHANNDARRTIVKLVSVIDAFGQANTLYLERVMDMFASKYPNCRTILGAELWTLRLRDTSQVRLLDSSPTNWSFRVQDCLPN